MDSGEEYEANISKRLYVSRRLQSKQSGFVISLAKQLIEEFDCMEFAKVVEQCVNVNEFFYRVLPNDSGVNGKIKNLIFAADGP